MKIKHAPYLLTFVFAAILPQSSAANEDVGRAIQERKLKSYGDEVAARYPARKAYFIHNQSASGMNSAYAVSEALKKAGKDTFVFEGFNYTGGLGEIRHKDWRLVEQADVVFCGCSSQEAQAVKDTVIKQGFTGQFVPLSVPK